MHPRAQTQSQTTQAWFVTMGSVIAGHFILHAALALNESFGLQSRARSSIKGHCNETVATDRDFISDHFEKKKDKINKA